MRCSADDSSLCVLNGANVPFWIARLDIAAGRQVLIREVAPPDMVGVPTAAGAAVADDPAHNACCYMRITTLRRGGCTVNRQVSMRSARRETR